MTAAEVEIDSGRLRGHRRDGVLRFDGIPYAAPPVGALRFRAPEPVAPWSGTRLAQHAPPGPLQRPGPTLGSRPVGHTSEDCLHVNVVTPDRAGSRPVMVWIYGGGFVNGAAADPIHAGERLVARGDVVLVTFDYRLGALGFLHTGASSNLGMRDQLAALNWIQRNIEAFGGDPHRVTLFGESAGAMCLLTLMGMPAADQLFHAGIVQSGAASWIADADAAELTRRTFAAEVGSDDPEVWRSLSTEHLLAAQQSVEAQIRAATGRGAFRPLLDGQLIEVDGQQAQDRAANQGRPLMLGSNGDEQRLFLAMRRNMERDDAVARLSRALPMPTPAARRAAATLLDGYADQHPGYTTLECLAAAETELHYRRPLLALAARREAASARSWNYLFTWPSPALRGRLGACHALEIPFVFGTLDAPGMSRFAGTDAEAWALSERMMDAWAAFARHGDPRSAVSDWHPWDRLQQLAWIADREARVESDPRAEEGAMWDRVLTSGAAPTAD